MSVKSGRKTTSAQFYTDLESKAQSSLNRVVSQCAQEFDCPISLVTALDHERQYVLAAHGVSLKESPRSLSFCQHTVEAQCPLNIPDAREDERLRNHPVVTGPPGIRSYLGVPLRHGDGEVIGALCLFDPRSDHFCEEDAVKLQRLAEVVEDILKLHVGHVEAKDLNRQISHQSRLLKKTLQIWQQAESIAKIGTWELEVGTNTLHWSEGVYAIHGYTDRPPVTVDEAVAFYEVEDRETVVQHVRNAIDDGKSYSFDATLNTLDGTVKRIRSRGECFLSADGKPERIVGVVQDISDAYQAELALRHAANHDPLTGLLNRGAFDRELQKRLDWARSDDSNVHLALFDLDGFKDINDTFGHVTGDFVLKDIAARISRSAPELSVVARWGGDEFAVILPRQTSAKEAESHANVMLAGIRQCAEIGNRSFEMSATAGLASADGTHCPKTLVRHADTALYHGKRADRASVQLYTADLDRHNSDRQRAMDEVRDALRAGRLFPGYMPIVDLRTGETVGLEALVRLTTQQGRQLRAAQVAPALIDPLLSRQVDDQMLVMVAQQAGKLFDAYPSLRTISVNATEGDLIAHGFAERFLTRLRKYGVAPACITLEVTETMLLVDEAERIKAVLQKLRSNGVRIALDDFGTGYSSLTHLRDFPIDTVKLDLSFVQAVNEDRQCRSIVQAMIGMAKNMGITVIAEGIERDDQRNVLQLMQCEYGQGYLFGKAMAADKLINDAAVLEPKHRLRA